MPGFIGGFDQPAADAAFDRLFQAATSEWGDAPFWCCASWGNADQEYRKFYYAPPAPLAGGWRPWQPPKLALPPWCDTVSDKTTLLDIGGVILPLEHHTIFVTFAPTADDTTRTALPKELRLALLNHKQHFFKGGLTLQVASAIPASPDYIF